MKVPAGHQRGSLELRMTPMIDVVFLLLVFFVWTSSFEEPEYDLPSSIAQPPDGIAETEVVAATPVEPFDEIILKIASQSGLVRYTLNDQPLVDLIDLSDRLKAILAIGVQPPVIIDPAEDITMDTAIEAYDVARTAGADRVLFAARADDDRTTASFP